MTTRANERPKHAPVDAGRGLDHGPRPAEKAVSFGPSLRRLLGMMRPERAIFAGVIAMGILSVLGVVVGPRILGQATDVIFAGVIGAMLPAGTTIEQAVGALRAAGKDDFADMLASMSGVVPGQGIDFALLARWLGLALVLYLVAAALGFFQNWLLTRAVQRTVYRIRAQTRAKLDRLPLSYYDRAPRGELLSRMTNDTDNIAQTLQQTLGQLLTALLTVIGVLAMMLSVSPLLSAITLLTLPLAAVVSIAIGKRAQTRFTTMWTLTGELNAEVEEAYTGHSLVKVFGRSQAVAERMRQTNEQLYQASWQAQFISGLMMPVNFFIGNLGYVAIAVIGCLRVASGQLNLGSVQSFIQYSRMLTQPITQIASMANLLQSGVASAERVFEVLDAEEMTPEGSAELAHPVAGHVEFREVSFSYSPERELITGLNLEARPGQTIAIVGPTGAGKTTLVNLLERFYDLDGGQILLDGVDTATLARSRLRDELGMVLQDTWLYAGTIAENIGYGRQFASRAEIEAAGQAAHVDDFVRRLPEGYDTMLNDEGTNISAGEKQLITIARAFISDPSVLILDEATSSVDTRTEILVQQAMNRLRAGRTSFVIAHRLSTIRNADLIVVMEQGRIVEQGSHDELIAARGAYYRLYQSQFLGAMDEVA